MYNAVMGSLDGDLDNVAFGVDRIRRILNRSQANIVNSENGMVFLELDGEVFSVDKNSDRAVKPFFIILNSGEAFNVSDYRILFEIRELPNSLVLGKDIGGQEYLCRLHIPPEPKVAAEAESGRYLNLELLEGKLESGDLSTGELEEIKDMVKGMRSGVFFESLTCEFSGKIKEIAQELLEFRREIKKRIEPGIVEIASKDIPEASNQLEGINDTLEKSTMKIMDINDEQMELSGAQTAHLQSFLARYKSNYDRSGERGQCATIVDEIKGGVALLPAEVRQVMEFVLPSLEQASHVLAGHEKAEAVLEALSEPMETISEICREVGPEEESVRRLECLARDLKETLGIWAASEDKVGGRRNGDGRSEALIGELEKQVQVLENMKGLSMKMLEPLSFQDLVGQRIQRTVRLVKSMESRIEDLIISFGIKLQRHKENPSRTYEELNREVERYKSELKGPQYEGEGLDQGDIDKLLANL